MSRALLTSWALFVGAQAAAVALGLIPVGDGLLFDPDGYARLLKVRQLLEGGRWFDSTIAALNAPFGLSMHWTRPLDLLILILAFPLLLVTDQSAALFWAGSAVSPLLGLAMIGVLHRCFAEKLGEAGFVMAMAFLSVQRGVVLAFAWGRPDHHALIIFLLAVVLALLAIRGRDERQEARRMDALGLACTLGLWVSLESLLSVMLCLGCLGLAAVWRGGSDLDHLWRYGRALALGALAALELDRLSAVHALMSVLIALVSFALMRLRLEGWGRRLGLGLGLAAVAAGVMAVVAPSFFLGPFAEVGPVARRMLVGRVTELLPLWSSGPGGMVNLLLELGGLPAAVAAVALGLRSRQPDQTILAVPHAIGLVLLVPATFHVVREAASLQLLCAVPVGQFCLMAWRKAKAQWGRGHAAGAVGLGGGALVLVYGGLAAVAVMHMTHWRGLRLTTPRPCQYQTAATQIRDIPGVVMVFPLEEAAAVAWSTGHGAVGGPYHRNDDGISDTLTFFGAMQPDLDAQDLARRRKIGVVMVCSGQLGGKLDPRRLISRLGQGQPPHWLRPLAETERGGGSLAIYGLTP